MVVKKITTSLMKFLILTLISQGAFAEDVEIIGSIKQTLKPSNNSASLNSKSINSTKSEKVIQLLQVHLSDEAKIRLANQAKNALMPPPLSTLSLADKALLGMNNVPVLDQGMHGTCVTFAVTGVLDAAIAKGDYISQLCNLQLGTYLEKHGYGVSGWDGSYATTVINQIEQYGIINKEKQRALGCGGLTKYPTYSTHNPELFMDPETYLSRNEFIFGNGVHWSDVYQKNNPTKTLDEVKQALLAGNRLVFATLIPHTELGFVGAVGKHNTWFYQDTWVLTPAILTGLDQIEAAHEMIITGYDDNAVAVDNNGKEHKGLLVLRNSWGSGFGDWGDFYMSYDYFKLLAFDVQRISASSI